ncbi:MAG: Smr/MutS family protein [Spirochaetales bacterium]|nr:Smr/MutS family protein [Spirochaetales bacterium]
MENRTVIDIEFDKVLNGIKKNALSSEGRDAIMPDLFTSDTSVLEERYVKIDTLMNKLQGETALEPFPSISHLFSYVKKTNRDIEGSDIYKCGEFLHAWHALLLFDERESEILKEDIALSSDILSSLSPEGDVNENHPRLRPLLKKREEAKNERFQFSSRFIQQNRGIVQNDNPLYRNERVVIPIKSSEKRNDEYYISGQSGSGGTTFVEPFELVDLNNRVVLAEEEIRCEKLKILHELSEKVRNILPFLKKALSEVIDFDFHYVFALWALKNKARHPRREERVSLVAARHPLLGAKAVPVTITLDEGTKVLVLSGANAGGKTVTMKTLALSVMLNQMCSFILADELSSLPLFDSIWTDIGDGQSIEKEASTFSAHMSNIAYITRKCSGRSLIILDELGSGTDPEEGSVLSVAILRYFSKKSYLTICTSHYSGVKNFAYTTEHMTNASMEFDEKTSLPTYHVLSGIPGDSHAISTAKRSGMPKEIVAEATENLGKGSETSARIITSLLSKSRTLDRKISLAENAKREAENKTKALMEEEKKLKEKILEAEKEGLRELNDYLSSSRRELENLVKAVKTGTLTKEKTKEVKNFIEGIENSEKKLRDNLKEKEDDEVDLSNNAAFQKGDEVLCGSARTRGLILEERGKGRFYVSLENGLRMEVKGNMLKHAKPEKAVSVSYTSSTRKAEYEMDVRGKTLKETEEMLDSQIEAALLRNMSSFSIIHGYGDGILQRGVHEYLKKNRFVKDYRFALPEDGGMGKTYVILSSQEAGQ